MEPAGVREYEEIGLDVSMSLACPKILVEVKRGRNQHCRTRPAANLFWADGGRHTTLWCKNGLMHRAGGPALISYEYEYNSTVYREYTWNYLNGELQGGLCPDDDL